MSLTIGKQAGYLLSEGDESGVGQKHSQPGEPAAACGFRHARVADQQIAPLTLFCRDRLETAVKRPYD